MRIIGALFVAALSFCIPYGPLALGVLMQVKRWKMTLPVAVGSLLVPYGALLAGVGLQVYAYRKRARVSA